MDERVEVNVRPQLMVNGGSVTVNRAPTDESVRILNEMQEEARKNILGSFPISDNGFEADLHFWLEPFRDKTVGICRFTLNGKKLEAKAEIDNFRRQEKQALIDKLRDEVAAIITVEILNNAFCKLEYRDREFVLKR